MTAIYETQDLPYQSSAASAAKSSTRAAQYQFDTPSVTFEKTSYVPSSPASFFPMSTGEQDSTEEGVGTESEAELGFDSEGEPGSTTGDGETLESGDLTDVTLPSDLSDLLGQLPDGEVG